MTVATDLVSETGVPCLKTSELAAQLCIGDVVFIRIPVLPFRRVAAATNTWTNHVGIVVDTSGPEPSIAESKFPLSRMTPLTRFIGRSDGRRAAVSRLRNPLTAGQQSAIAAAARRRSAILYDTGFNLLSGRQFCSRFVREVVHEATGTLIGEVETFATLLERNPDADLSFWRLWFFGRIPWARQTVTPVSLLRSPHLVPVFDGVVR
jgi:Permuted papain-like amidase enzyme, YaeF/YiiX, C92 family